MRLHQERSLGGGRIALGLLVWNGQVTFARPTELVGLDRRAPWVPVYSESYTPWAQFESPVCAWQAPRSNAARRTRTKHTTATKPFQVHVSTHPRSCFGIPRAQHRWACR